MSAFPPSWLSEYWHRLQDAPLIELKRASLFLAIVTLPLGHLLGVSFLIATALLSLRSIEWKFGGVATSLCLPLVVAYGLILGAELLSPNSVDVTLETAFNYLPLLLLPVIFAGCWRSGIDIQQLTQAVLISAVLMALMALAEVFVFQQPKADGNIFDVISIAPTEFALVAFLYGLIISSALLVNRQPFVNRVQTPFIVLGLLSCLTCIWLTGTRVMLVPTAVVALVGLFAVAFNSRHRWIAPSMLVVVIFGGVAVSGLPMVQGFYNDLFGALANAVIEPRGGMLAERLSKGLAGWQMAQDHAVVGFGNIHAALVALQEYRLDDWPVFPIGFHFGNAFIDHMVLFGAIGLAGLLIVLMAPLVVVGPTWFRLYAAIVVLGTTLYACLGRFLNNDITGAAMLVMWLSLLLTQALVGRKTP